MRTCYACSKELPLTAFYPKHARCKKCVVAFNKQWRLDNPDKFKQQWKRAQRTRARKASQKKYRQSINGKLSLKRGWKKWRHSPRGKARMKELNARYRKSDKGKANYNRGIIRYKKTEKGRLAFRRQDKRRRALENGAFTFRYPGDFATLLALYEHRCGYCDRGGLILEEDHIVPLSKGGDDAWYNLVPACRSCNARKCNKTWWPRPLKKAA